MIASRAAEVADTKCQVDVGLGKNISDLTSEHKGLCNSIADRS